METFLKIPIEQWTQLLTLLVVFALGWFVLRLLLKLTIKVFSIGCIAILFLSICVFVFRVVTGS